MGPSNQRPVMAARGVGVAQTGICAENAAETRVRVRLLEFHVVDHCNLQCSGCSHFSPSAPKRNVSAAEIERELRAATRSMAPQWVHVLGGEPTLNPELPALLPLFRAYFPDAGIKLVTNGSRFGRVKRRLLPVLAEQRIALSVSRYPEIALDWAEIERDCAAAGVELEIWDQTTFMDFLDPTGTSDPVEARAHCAMEGCLNVRDGVLYPCPVAAWPDLAGGRLVVDDGISLGAGADALAAILDTTRLTSMCRYCLPRPARMPHVQGDRRPLLQPLSEKP